MVEVMIKSQLLYQLSYAPARRGAIAIMRLPQHVHACFASQGKDFAIYTLSTFPRADGADPGGEAVERGG